MQGQTNSSPGKALSDGPTMPKEVLLVDDDATFANNIREHLERNGWKVAVCASAEQALSIPEQVRPRIVVADYMLPGKTGLHLLKQVITANSRVKVVMITGHGEVELAVAAMRAGAYDFLTKPVALRDLTSVLDRALENIDDPQAGLNGHTRQSAARPGLESIIGAAPAMAALKARLSRLLDAERNLQQGDHPAVLITGETGTGKELVARTLHADGLRHEGPFIEVNCAAIPANLLESVLFGHERGAFTDAKERKAGLVETAEGGTLFLDEIGELDFSIQAKLLKWLEERTVRRIGGICERKVDVRIVSATNQDLEKMVRAGRFRPDLLFRLRIISLHMPPLRERAEDVLPLAREFLQIYRDRYGRPELGFAAETERTLLAYHWPGNVRELKNSVEQAVLLTRGGVILPANMALCSQIRHDTGPGGDSSPVQIREERTNVDRVNRARIEAAIGEAGWNIAMAARLLGISRDTLRYRLRKYGLAARMQAGALPRDVEGA